MNNKKLTFKSILLILLITTLFVSCKNNNIETEAHNPSPTGVYTESTFFPATSTSKEIVENDENPTPDFENPTQINPAQTETNTITLADNELQKSTSTTSQVPTKSPIPSRTPIPTSTRRPTRTPSITSTPQPPLAFYRINNLGSYSKVISPIIPESLISPGQNGIIYIELFGEDGRIISKEIINYYNYIGKHFGIAPEIEFEIKAVAETGRLVLYSNDRYNRTMWLTSVDLILLQLGQNNITKPQDFTEPYIIRWPEEGDTVQGGMLQVQGVARILNTNPLLFDCIDQDGNIISSGEVTIHASSEGISHIPFEAYLPYQVNEPTNVRLSIRQESATKLPGTISLTSFVITLAP